MLSLTYTSLFLMPFPKHIYNGQKTLFFFSLVDNPNVSLFHTLNLEKKYSDPLFKRFFQSDKVNTVYVT